MSVSQLADRPAAALADPEHRPGRAALRKARSRKGGLLARYLGYVGYFVGAGLISGAVVHHPLDPARYTRIAVYGVLVFLAATALNEFLLARRKPTPAQVASIMGASLLLSFGIGMLSGGLQHFEDFPGRAALLIPTGIVLSFIAYVIKDEDSSWRRVFGLAGLTVLVTTLIAFAGLRYVASTLAEEPGSGGHSHGSESSTDNEPHQEEPTVHRTPSQATTTPAATRSPSSDSAHNDGHNH
ncbi:hypothetical protein MTF65_03045 [Streptomyces sp. APSN-46.1]|uniref:hypothetical protein n=1 Tax=Streptomyces sp. APSN-46.1 TaxID=2929049 RepID=UPI001FB21116|nr:hypothetical protein [Streptomyces sp. APSN-46.1]MCJ1676345.1 hypothetical protein [Streptomyces sp. APSN-46.1]